jgi:hypothetical protein
MATYTDNGTLYVRWVQNLDLSSEDDFATDYCLDDREATVDVFIGKHLHEALHLDDKATDVLMTALGWLECGDRIEAGTIAIDGWYTEPTYCWSDPSCSDAGDGDVDSLTLSVDADGLVEALTDELREWLGDILKDSDEDLGKLSNDELAIKAREKLNESNEWLNAVKNIINNLPQVIADELVSELDEADIL